MWGKGAWSTPQIGVGSVQASNTQNLQGQSTGAVGGQDNNKQQTMVYSNKTKTSKVKKQIITYI